MNTFQFPCGHETFLILAFVLFLFHVIKASSEDVIVPRFEKHVDIDDGQGSAIRFKYLCWL